MKDVWVAACRWIAPHTIVHFTSTSERAESHARASGFEAVVIPNGIDVPDATDSRAIARPLRVGCLGRVHPMKQLNVAIAACERARSMGVEVSLDIAGAGAAVHETELRRVASRASVPVRLVGHVEGNAKDSFLRGIDVLLAPSIRENFGLAIAEALAYGKYVIASRGTPWSELDRRGCGRWVDATPDAFGDALLRVTSNEISRARDAGPRWMRESYSWDRVAHDMALAYERAVSGVERRTYTPLEAWS